MDNQPDIVDVADGGAVIDTLISSMSPPNPDAIASVRQEVEPLDNSPAADPEPVKRGRGRPKGSITKPAKPTTRRAPKSKVNIPKDDPAPNVADAPQVSPDEKRKTEAQLTGAGFAQVTFLAATIIGGPDFQPAFNPLTQMHDAEMLTKAYADYCYAKGVTDLSPGIVLSLALLSYAAPRFTKPATQSRVKSMWEFTKRFFGKFRRKNGARFDPRNDGERQEHVGQASSASVQGA